MALNFLIGAGTQMIGGLIGGFSAKKRARAARRQAAEYAKQLKTLEESRQQIIDPSKQVQDLSSLVTNPFANLQVATGAAEMQAQQADLSLAQTLDTLRATGSAAGGATALAQAALRSKQGVAASIEKQEALNTRLRAQGEQRSQMMQLQEGSRVQASKMRGQEFMFRAREKREQQQLDRTAALQQQFQSQAASFGQAADQSFGQAIGALGGAVVGGLAGSAGYKQAVADGYEGNVLSYINKNSN